MEYRHDATRVEGPSVLFVPSRTVYAFASQDGATIFGGPCPPDPALYEPEYDVFVAEMPRVLRCRFMPQDDLRAGRWRAHIDALLAQSAPPERARIDGARVAAELISRIL